MSIEVGSKVRVNITRVEEWAVGAFTALHERKGVVESVKDTHWNGREEVKRKEPLVLVRFDEPAPGWGFGRQPRNHFHFAPRELVVIR